MKELVKKYYIYVVILMIVVLVIVFIPIGEDMQPIDFEPNIDIPHEDIPEYIYIDIKGQVQNPGVYKVLINSRLFQLLNLAGGTTSKPIH